LKSSIYYSFLFAVLLLVPKAASAQWSAVEKIEPYAITGKSGASLYASIGEKGPQLGGGIRTIAHTNFKLTWTRKYERQADNACTLVSARPKLIITYTLPKPSGRLPEAVQQSWDTFIAGVKKHELVHGEMIKDMVRAIEASTVGLSVPDDPGCRKIRSQMQPGLSALSMQQRQKSRDFDRDEMSGGGNIHQLILNLVNGP
jgi:predicted secreted Zn-dependent protease